MASCECSLVQSNRKLALVPSPPSLCEPRSRGHCQRSGGSGHWRITTLNLRAGELSPDAQRTKLTGAERTARSAAGEASGLSERLGILDYSITNTHLGTGHNPCSEAAFSDEEPKSLAVCSLREQTARLAEL